MSRLAFKPCIARLGVTTSLFPTQVRVSGRIGKSWSAEGRRGGMVGDQNTLLIAIWYNSLAYIILSTEIKLLAWPYVSYSSYKRCIIRSFSKYCHQEFYQSISYKKIQKIFITFHVHYIRSRIRPYRDCRKVRIRFTKGNNPYKRPRREKWWIVKGRDSLMWTRFFSKSEEWLQWGIFRSLFRDLIRLLLWYLTE